MGQCGGIAGTLACKSVEKVLDTLENGSPKHKCVLQYASRTCFNRSLKRQALQKNGEGVLAKVKVYTYIIVYGHSYIYREREKEREICICIYTGR